MTVSDIVLPLVAIPSCLIGCAVAGVHAYQIVNTPIAPPQGAQESQALVNSGEDSESPEMYDRIKRISTFIAEGADAFLFAEYSVLSVFVAVFSVFLFTALAIGTNKDWAAAGFATGAFLLGAITSVVSGFIGMRIAVNANSRTAISAKIGYRPAFNTAFKAGMVMGFGLSSVGLLVLTAIVYVFRMYFKGWNNVEIEECHRFYEAVSGYGLGGSAIALFGRVGGGIYTKAADVGADLSGKVIEDFPEDDPRNPAVIADNVGDNVGDIAGMGADLFGSIAEGSCAAMVIASTTSMHTDWVALNFPILYLSTSIISSWVCSFLATTIKPVDTQEEIEPALKLQLVSSTVLMSVLSAILALTCLPETITYDVITTDVLKFKNYHVLVCLVLGLWTGLAIGYITDYYTSFAHAPVKELTQACQTGAATNVIYGLALGYKSAIIPVACMAVTIFAAFRMAGLYGIAAAALGVLGNVATALSIDAYGPICDNAGGIAEMCHMPSYTRDRTDALDAAGNTTAAIGKGGAIASAILVALALFGAFISSSKGSAIINLLDAHTLSGLLFGAMLPYWFSALTMKSVGDAAYDMVKEVERQLDVATETGRLIRQQKQDPDYAACIKISTQASLREMIAPGALVIVTPIVTGFVFGRSALAGLLMGILTSGTQIAISASNTGGAWDNCKKLLTAQGVDKKSEQFIAAVTGDTVGDPLKDTSGPSINILIKLSAIISVVLAPSFPETPLLDYILDKIGA